MKKLILFVFLLGLAACAQVKYTSVNTSLKPYFMSKDAQNQPTLMGGLTKVSYIYEDGVPKELNITASGMSSGAFLQLENAKKLRQALREVQSGKIKFSDLKVDLEVGRKTYVSPSPFKDENGQECFALMSTYSGFVFFSKAQIPEFIKVLDEFIGQK